MHGTDSLLIVDVIEDLWHGSAEGQAMAYSDIRVAERADWLIERVAAAGTLVLRRVGETRAGELAVHRFLSSPYVSVENIVETLAGKRWRTP